MKRAAVLISDLRRAGVLLGVRDGRVTVQAPRGVITPEIQTHLLRHKLSVISLIEHEKHQTSSDRLAAAEGPINEIAGLMAKAYLRYQRIPRVSPDSFTGCVPGGLALSGPQSVHGWEHL